MLRGSGEKSKMVLIEAAKIDSGGGYGLLLLLIRQFKVKTDDFRVILAPDIEVKGLPERFVYRRKVNVLNRSNVFLSCVSDCQPESILCFGNFPPPIRFENIRTYTYFHRVGLIEQHKYGATSLFRKLTYFSRSWYLKTLLKNTDEVFCQSEGVRQSFFKHFKFDKNKIKIFPFFDINSIQENCVESVEGREEDSFIYVSNDALHKNHNNLLTAWETLASEGLFPKLYLTLPTNSYLVPRITKLSSIGVKVVNLGVVAYDHVLKKMMRCQFAIYPSLQESLGLGLVEAVFANLKIIAADLPYTYEVIKPSISFNPFRVDDIVEKVKFALVAKELPNSELLLENKLNPMIEKIIG